ncbi:MAG TPA: MFS transporter [Vicinamibacterales bacterium]|nr:MFS transporter [Vicinamibacterales bacterium]
MLSRDAALIYAAAFLRSSAVGLVGVILAIALTEAGVSVAGTGLVIGAGLAGIATLTAVVTVAADRLGRRRTLVLMTLLTAGGYLAAATSARLAWLLPAAFLGMLNGMGRDRGPAGTLEQAILPETTGAARRTWTLAWYNLVLDAGHALGGLAAALPVTHRTIFVACAVSALAGVLPYAALSKRVEVVATASSASSPDEDRRTRRSVSKLALLFGIDSLGGGFLSSALIAYWFFQRYGFTERDLAILFFAARSLNAVSHVAAAWLARRIGLLNTMVLTHLPSSLLLMVAPATSSGTLAAGLFLGRESLVEMDVPTRQSYVMAIVPPHRRTYASGVTNLTRTIGWAVGPPIAGVVMQYVVLAAPLFIGGGMKIVYDIVLYRSFRHVRPPEETASSRL